MQKIPFSKYQGTGNDFVMIDNRSHTYLTKADTDKIQWLCDRKMGVGADGLILLQNREGFDFEMVYFNADGRESSMCGNGGRCIVAFAKSLDIVSQKAEFIAIDGPHTAVVKKNGWIELKMNNVTEIEQGDDYFIMDTGSPHYVIFVEDLTDINIVENGKAIRYSDRFRKEGINVNFVENTDQGIAVATYERGVEDETLSCGTGVTAAAISHFSKKGIKGEGAVAIRTKGGSLEVKLNRTENGYQDIWLCGPAVKVFEGVTEVVE